MILAAFFIFAALGSLTLGRHPYDLGWPSEWFGDDEDYDPADDELEDWYCGLRAEDARTDQGAN